MNSEKADYFQITEHPGLKATKEQVERIYHRYHFARKFAKGKDVLEVACGSGIGLGYLQEVANSVTGGDIDEKNIEIARKYYKDRIKVEIMDAHSLPFPENSFDLVLLYEAIYYLKEPQSFIKEASRVLRDEGVLIICTVNKDWEDFHPSPYTYNYFSVPELYEALKNEFREIEMYGAFKVEYKGMKDKVVSLIKRLAVNFNLIPGSLSARAYLKRIFMGKLLPIPEELKEGMCEYYEPVPISLHKKCEEFKIIYAVAKKGGN
ncbi:class I SAM-dependent methyltransferase [Thermodesulfovibrio sp. TK110]